MTMVGLFAGTAPTTAPVGNAAAGSAEGASGFGAALLGAVAATTPALFAGKPVATPVAQVAPLTTQDAAPAKPAATPAIPGLVVADATAAPESSTPVAVAAVEVAAPVAPEADAEPAKGTAAPTKAKKATDATADAAPQTAVTAAPVTAAPIAPATAAAPQAQEPAAAEPAITPAVAATAAAVTAAPTAAPAAPTITATQAVTAPPAPAAAGTESPAVPVSTTVVVSGVAVELVASSVAEKPSAVKPAAHDVSGAAAAAVTAASANAPAAASVSAPAATSAAAPAAPAAPTFTEQLSKPLFTLAAAPDGDHIVTVKVTPDNLGPVTVRAHVGAEGMRVELFAPNDAGREAIRSILPDLRKDLAGQGLSANLDLSSQNQPFDRGGDAGARERGASTLPGRQESTQAQRDAEQPARRTHTSTSLLDVLA